MPAEASPSLARMEAWGGALLRAMAGDASLQWSGQTLYRGTAPVVLAAAHQSDVPARLADQRGLLDGASLRLRLSDAALHARHLPGDPVERLVFELLEQLNKRKLPTRTVVLTMSAQPRHVAEAMRLGAYGYVLKGSPATEVVQAVEEVEEVLQLQNLLKVVFAQSFFTPN